MYLSTVNAVMVNTVAFADVSDRSPFRIQIGSVKGNDDGNQIS